MRERFRRFMIGRYGGDQLGSFLSAAALVLFVLGLFGHKVFYYLGLGVLVWSYFRMFSRNLTARRAENQWYLGKRAVVQRQAAQWRQRFALRRTYRYFRCPRCQQELRVPRGRGRISISCPKCGTQFVKKS